MEPHKRHLISNVVLDAMTKILSMRRRGWNSVLCFFSFDFHLWWDATRLTCRHARKITMYKAVYHNVNEFNIEILSEFFFLHFRFIGFPHRSSTWRRRTIVRLNLFSHFVGAPFAGVDAAYLYRIFISIYLLLLSHICRMNCVGETDRGEERWNIAEARMSDVYSFVRHSRFWFRRLA